jgi:hypothetical protein
MRLSLNLREMSFVLFCFFIMIFHDTLNHIPMRHWLLPKDTKSFLLKERNFLRYVYMRENKEHSQTII